MARKLVVEIIGDASSLEKAFGKAEKSGKGFAGSIGKVSKAAAFGAGAAALGGLALVVKRGADEFNESQKVMAQTVAGLKSTGNAAKVTAKHVTDLATAVSNYSGIDDEAVQAGENMLLTFTDIRNEVGKGNDIFDQATKTVADLATKMNNGAIPSAEQLTKTSIQVGKALNDPVKGLTALSKIGVTFTEQQKETIKGLTGTGNAIKDLDTAGVHLSGKQKNLIKDMGDTTDAFKAARLAGIKLTDAQLDQLTVMSDGTGKIKAQKIILKELRKEFGGSAKAAGGTLAGQLKKLSNSFDQLSGTIFAKLVPAITKIVDGLNDLLAIFQGSGTTTDKFQKALERLGVSAKTSARIIADLKETFNDLKTVVVTTFNIIRPILEAFYKQIQGIVQLLNDVLHGRWKKIWGDLATIVQNTVNLWKKILETGIKTLGGVALKIGKALLGGLVKGLEGLGRKIIDLIVAPINAIIRQANRIPGVHIGEIGGAGGGATTAGAGGGSPAHTGARPPATTGLAPTPHPVTGPPGGRGAVVFNGPVNVHGVQDPQQFIKWAQRQARVTSPSRSGPFGGHNVGLT